MKTLFKLTFNSFLVLMCIMTFMSQTVFSQTDTTKIYVNAATGNDSKNGYTDTAAFLTIAKAISIADPGETIFVAAGTYNEMITPIKSGEVGKPITFMADSGAVFINGSGLNYGFDLTDKSYITIKYFNIQTQNLQAIRIASVGSDVTDILIEGCTINDWHTLGNPSIAVLITSGASHNVKNVKVEKCTFNSPSTRDSKVISIEGLNVNYLNDNIEISKCQFQMFYMKSNECIVSNGFTKNLFVIANRFSEAQKALFLNGDSARNIYFVNNYVSSSQAANAYGVVVNNTTYQNVNILYNTFRTNSHCFTGYPNGVKMVNNILASNSLSLYVDGALSQFDECNYNLFSTGGTIAFWNGTSYVTIGDFQLTDHSLGADDTNSSTGDPGFISPSGPDIHSESMVIDQALPITAAGYGIDVNKDINGRGRDKNTPNIGAFEAYGNFHGNYTIGGANGDFNSFNDALSALATVTLDGPVTFNVFPQVYYEKIDLTNISGVSAINTISFVGQDSASTILAYNSGASQLANITNTGLSYVSFKNIKVEASSMYGYCVQLNGMLDSISFENCWFKGISYSNPPCLVSSPSSTMLHYVNFKKCFFENGNAAFIMYPEGAGSTHISFEGNIFKGQVAGTAFMKSIDYFDFIGNKLYNESGNSKLLEITNMQNVKISDNIFKTTADKIGLRVSNVDTALIINNSISTGGQYGVNEGTGMYFDASYHVKIYHNTIKVLNTNNSNTRGLYIDDQYEAGGSYSVKNNIIASYGGNEVMTVASSTLLADFNDNDLYSNGVNYASIGGTTYANLTDLQNAYSYSNIYDIDPILTDGDVLIPLSCALTATGVNLQDTVPNDIFGVHVRPAAPSLGVIEYSNNAITGGTIEIGKNKRYMSLSEVFRALPSCVSVLDSSLTLLLTDSLYIEPNSLFIDSLSWLSSANRLTIKPAPGVNTKIKFQTSSDAMPFIFNDCSYITIDGSNNGTNSRNLEIEAVGSNPYLSTSVISFNALNKPIEDIEIKNCVLTGQSYNPVAGAIHFEGESNVINNIRIINNHLRGSTAGIMSNASLLKGVRIEKNKIGDFNSMLFIRKYGINIMNSDSLYILDNEILNIMGGNEAYGINLANTSATNIERNKIHDIIMQSGPYACGISLKPKDAGSVHIFNNTISSIAASGNTNTTVLNPTGIYITLDSNSPSLPDSAIQLYHNSIYLNRDSYHGLSMEGSMAVGLYISNYNGLTNKIDLLNNIVDVRLGEDTMAVISSNGYAIYLPYSQSPFFRCNFNIYHIANFDNNYLGTNVVSNYSDFTTWRTGLGNSGIDTASFIANPLFTNISNLKPTGLSVASNNGKGGLVNEDIAMNARNAVKPDIGAYEFDVLAITTQPLADSLCIGSVGSLSIATNMAATKEWQESTDSSSWVIIGGATSDIYNYTSAIVGQKFYRCIVSAAGYPNDTSEVVKHTVLPLPSIGISLVESSGFITNDGIICNGDSVTLIASGGSSYLWSSGETTASILKGLGATFTVTGTDIYGCVSNANSTIVVRSIPSVNAGMDVAICFGDSASLSASPTDAISYLWTPSGGIGNVASKNTKASPAVSTNYLVSITDTSGCVGKDSVYITVNPLNIVSIAISGSATNVCSGTTVTYTATPTNGGATPAYQWKVNGSNVGTDQTTYSYSPLSGDAVTCVLTSNILCASSNPATSNSVSTTVDSNLPVSVSISGSATNVCSGTLVTYTASPTNGGATPAYQWKVNGANVGTDQTTYSYSPASGDSVSCVLTSNALCATGNPATSNSVSTTVDSNLPVSVSISGSAANVCAGTTVTYTAIPTNEGVTPAYQWKVNGANVGTDQTSYSYSPASGDSVTCVLTSNALCATGNPAISNSVSTTVNPNLPVSVSVTESDNNICSGTTVSYIATPINGGGAPTYQWKVNGISVGTSIPGYSYIPVNGDNVSCILTSNESCVSNVIDTSANIIMAVDAAIVVNLSKTDINAADTVGTITVAASGGDNTFTYSLNGAGFVGSNFYNNLDSGTYKILVMDGKGCLDSTITHLDDLRPICNAIFTSVVDSVYDLKISFINSSQGVTDYYWSFGDGNNSNTISPVYTYSKNGVYEVCLNANNNVNNCKANKCTSLVIGGSDPAFVSAFFKYSVDSLSVTFADSSINASQYYWVFGDGGLSTLQNPAYTFKKAGNYNVCLKVFNKAYGTVANYCQNLLVGAPTCSAIANFTYSIDTSNIVSFTNLSGGSINAYYWDFGNGLTSSSQHAKYQYTKPGYYFVSLAVRDTNSGCASYAADMIKVGTVNCRADFDADVDVANNKVQFINNSQGDLSNYFWLFGDNDYSTSIAPIHTFSKAGLYSISLTVADATGSCVDYFEKPIQIGELGCNAHYTYYVDSSALKAYFYSSDLNDNTQKYWLFGDGKLSLESNPDHTYPAPGIYNVSLTSYNSTNSCMDYYSEPVLVGSLGRDCEADFAYRNVDNVLKTKFLDKSKGDINKWFWNFGDKSIPSTDQNPEHIFNSQGFFNVCLTVENNFGISNITCKTVAVGTDPVNYCKAGFSFYTDTVERSVLFTDNSYGEIDLYNWEFGDGGVSSATNPSHTYLTPGYYLVSQEVVNSVQKCSDVSLQLLNIAMKDSFKASFKYIMHTYNKKAGGYPVDLVGAGLGDDARLKWDFGDGEQDSTTNSPNHLYTDTAIREYNVCLTLSDPITGAEDTHCEMVKADQLCQTDINPPTAICKGTYNLVLDITGNATLLVDSINNGSYDDCYLADKILSKTAFTTANIGNNTVKFIVTDVRGNADTCETVVKVSAATGIVQTNLAVNLSVFPNPVDKMLNIHYNLLRNSNVELYITDLLGKRVATVSSGKFEGGEKNVVFDASSLMSGSYILQLRAANGPISQRIIIKR